jgi:hypothetical protein
MRPAEESMGFCQSDWFSTPVVTKILHTQVYLSLAALKAGLKQ